MEFYDVIKKRRSVRRYRKEKIPRDVMLRILEAARLAPSAENAQPWRIVVVDEDDLLKELCRNAFSGIYMPSKFACKAAAIVVMLAQPSMVVSLVGRQLRKIEFYLLDLGIVGEHIVLAATREGIGSCWIGWFNEKGVRKTLGIGKKYRVVSLIALGYPEGEISSEHRRKALDEIVKFNQSF